MKKTLTIVSTLLTAILITTASLAAAPNPQNAGWSASASGLSAEEAGARAELAQAISSMASQFRTTGELTLSSGWSGSDEAFQAMFADVKEEVAVRHPEYMIYNAGYSRYGDSLSLILGYFVDDPASASASVSRRIASVLSTTIESSDTDYQKAKKLHDYLVQNCEYDSAAEADPALNLNAYIAYGALIEGKAVCDGYAKAYAQLCQAAGLDCTYVGGNAYDSKTGQTVPHAWNNLTIGGNTYLVDVTWDDPINAPPRYNYFMIGAQKANAVYTPDPFFQNNLCPADYDPSSEPAVASPLPANAGGAAASTASQPSGGASPADLGWLRSAAVSAAERDVQAARASGLASAETRIEVANIDFAGPEVFQAVNEAVAASSAGQAGVAVTPYLAFDTMDGKVLLSRVTVNSTKAALLPSGIWTELSPDAALQGYLQPFFQNEIRVYSFAQPGSFGMEILAEVPFDMASQDVNTLAFYQYDPLSNHCAGFVPSSLEAAGGLLRFATANGGAVIVSNGALVSR